MAHYRDLRGLIKLLDERGKVHRYRGTINKDTELVPFYRVQQRGIPEEERKVFLFEDIVDAQGKKYDLSVVSGIYGVSDEILAIGMGCENYVEMLERWHHGIANPIPPVLVDHGPVQEEVHQGEELKHLGLGELPVPVEDPGLSGMIRTGMPMITKDPESGAYNVGTYNGFFAAPDRIAAGIAPNKHAMFYHAATARRRQEPLPLAIVIGCNPDVMLVGSARIPYGEDELAIAGGISGSPVELVRCKTIPLEVPAQAEIVIEGLLSTEFIEPKGAFGEYPGHLNVDRGYCPVLNVTAITHRKDAMFTPIPVGFPPSDCNAVFGFCYSGQVYHFLKYERGLPVEEVYFPQLGGGSNFCAIRVSDGTSQEDVWEILHGAAASSDAKYLMALDYDINIHDPELLVWAMSFRSQPDEDVRIIPGGMRKFDPSAIHRSGRLDPSARQITPDDGTSMLAADGVDGRAGSRKEFYLTLINATRKYPYPPVALPKREYMERALRLWKAQEVLPQPKLREPWYGYMLGYWNEDLQEDADLIVRGRYAEAGDKHAKQRKRFEDVQAKPG